MDKHCDRWGIPEIISDHIITSSNMLMPSDLKLADEKLQQIEKYRKITHDQAFNAGHNAGKLAGSQELESIIMQLKELLNNLQLSIQNLNNKYEQDLVNAIDLIVNTVIRQEATTNKNIILQLVQEALRILPVSTEDLEIHLNPQDYEFVVQHNDLIDHKIFAQYNLVANKDISLGGCKITSSCSNIDASLETRIAAVMQKLYE